MIYRWSSPPFRDPTGLNVCAVNSISPWRPRCIGYQDQTMEFTERLSEELEVIVSTAAHDEPNCILYQIQLDPDSSHEVFRIKLSGDGAKFSRCSNLFLVSFAILHLEQRVLSPRGTCNLVVSFVVAAWHCLWTDNHTVAVVKIPECHDILATTLEPLLQEIKLLMESQIIEVEGKQYQVELFLRGDLKVGWTCTVYEQILSALVVLADVSGFWSWCFWVLDKQIQSMLAYGVWCHQLIGKATLCSDNYQWS